MHPTPSISVVIPMYNEAAVLEALFARLLPVLQSITPDWEVVCINDGSSDNTQELLSHWHRRESRIHYVALSRNFGKEAALTAGLERARGQAVIPFDADLQDPPELIPELVAEWRKGFKVVLACRRSRTSDHWLKRSSAALYYNMMGRLTKVPVPSEAGDFRLMDRDVVEVLRHLPERTRFMKGLFVWVGFSTQCVYFDRAPRAAGAPSQSITKLVGLAKDGVFSFSTIPLQFTTFIGVLVSICAMTYALWLVLRTLILGVDLPGYASLMVAMLGLGGIQLVCLGIMGEYIGRIYRETKQRPLYIIEKQSEVANRQ